MPPGQSREPKRKENRRRAGTNDHARPQHAHVAGARPELRARRDDAGDREAAVHVHRRRWAPRHPRPAAAGPCAPAAPDQAPGHVGREAHERPLRRGGADVLPAQQGRSLVVDEHANRQRAHGPESRVHEGRAGGRFACSAAAPCCCCACAAVARVLLLLRLRPLCCACALSAAAAPSLLLRPLCCGMRC